MKAEIFNLKYAVAAWVLVAGAAFAGLESERAYQMNEAQLIEIVQKGDSNDRVTACQELTHRGGPASVPVLAALLDNDSKRAEFHAALYGLQNIPGPEADAALAAAEKKVSGPRLDAIRHARAVRANPVLDGYAGATE